MSQSEVAKVAALTDEQRDVFTRLLLAITHSEPQRRALIAGYNGEPCPSPASDRMRRNYRLGKQVRAYLGKQQS